MSSTQASKKKTKPLFCRVCKEYFKLSEKEFKAAGHYPNDEKSHLLPPDLGKSTKRHSRAVKRDNDRLLFVAVQKEQRKKRKEALDEGLINADLDPV